MILSTPFISVLLIGYIAMILSPYFATISPEELVAGKKWLHLLRKLAFACLVFYLAYSILPAKLSLAVSLTLSIASWWVQLPKTIAYILFPVIIYLDFLLSLSVGTLSGIYLILIVIQVSLSCIPYVKKKNHRKLECKRIELIKKIIKETSPFWISFFLVLAISLF